jgi:hypothetical protein
LSTTPQISQKKSVRLMRGEYRHGHFCVFTLWPAARQPAGLAIGATSTAFAGPRVVSFGANLTPDQETDLGRRT